MAAKRSSGRRLLLFLVDVLIIIIAFNLALFIRLGQTLLDLDPFQQYALAISIIFAYVLSFYVFDFYNPRLHFWGPGFLASMGGAFGLAFFLSILSSYLLQYRLGRGVFLISWALTAALIYGWRFAYSVLFRLHETRRNVLILGNGVTTEAVIPALRNDPEFRLAAIMDKRLLKDMLARDSKGLSEGALVEFVEENRINDIVVSFETDVSGEMERAMVNCRMKGIGCYTFEAFYERLFEKLPVLMLNDRWFLMSGGFGTLGNRFYNTLKRGFDFGAAGLILLLTLPVSVLVALLIPLTSKGPVFFTQSRLGAGKVPFKIIKFRTMLHGAEANGPQWARNKDGRVTGIGKILRKARIDEIPQLVDVLKGEMSLIGPRPEREYFVAQLTEKIPFYALRFFVKPGITGWAQVNFHYGSNEEDALEKLRYELYYIKNRSLSLDARILMKTLRVVLTGQGT